MMTVARVSKVFNRRPVLRDIDFSLSTGESLAITGRNGSGKSTLIKILAGLLSPTSGLVRWTRASSVLGPDDVRVVTGFVSPYFQLYEEFTPMEHLGVISRIRSGRDPDAAAVRSLLEEFGLWSRRHDEIRTFSSGMKQRLKYVAALSHAPWMLLLDEPTSNLDAEGVETVKSIAARQTNHGILIVATNEEQEAQWCTREVRVGLEHAGPSTGRGGA
jgi:heme exporter protein A